MFIGGKVFFEKISIGLLVIYLAFLLFDFKMVNLILPLVFVTSFINFREATVDLKDYLKENKSIFLMLLILVLYQFFRALIGNDLEIKELVSWAYYWLHLFVCLDLKI